MGNRSLEEGKIKETKKNNFKEDLVNRYMKFSKVQQEETTSR